ncbi:hypothetical protein [Ruania zhangjianzhongii]|uniref:hypothetical protein n=1 Tax=Ruania zhangjianzhongii TaxID=2603206 RepID=UPI0011C7F8C1|nr:hypothetical protein [Ruania zhangjianzhongii]
MAAATHTRSHAPVAGETPRRPEDWSVPEIAEFLNENLGPKLTAYLVGKDPQTVARWIKREQISPQPDVERKLRGVFQIFDLLVKTDSRHVVRAWFIGMNPQLDDHSPAEVLAGGDTRSAMAAARSFSAGG